MNTVQSSILMILSAVCYVALLFNHTFKEMGSAAW